MNQGQESKIIRDPTIWRLPENDKSQGLSFNTANFRANPSSLSTVTYQATQPLAMVQSEQSLDDWLEQLWTKPVQTKNTKPRNLTNEETSKLRTDTKAALDFGKCRAKLNELLDSFGKKFKQKGLDGDKLTGIDALAEKFLQGKGHKLQVEANIGARADYLDKQIRFNEFHFTNDTYKLSNYKTFLHELAHGFKDASQGVPHFDLASAISKIEGIPQGDVGKYVDNYIKKMSDGTAEDDTKQRDDAYSNILSTYIYKYCDKNADDKSVLDVVSSQ